LPQRPHGIWYLIIICSCVFALLYFWATLFPNQPPAELWRYFTVDQANRSRAYNLGLRLAYIGSFVLQAGFLFWLVQSGRAAELERWVQIFTRQNYWASVLTFFSLVWLMLLALNLPFSFFSNYAWQHAWGFSTQGLTAWWSDFLKSAALDAVLAGGGVLAFYWLTGHWPRTWWLFGAVCFSLWLAIQSFLWPVVVAPLFNKFVPATDPAVVDMVHALAAKAGLPVDQVLIMDASSRTTKANAYFAGLGRTKQIVLYDNLLKNYPPQEVKAVVAHEMAHWSRGHIAKGLLLGTAGNLIVWYLLYLVLGSPLGVNGRFPPQVWVLVLLFFTLVSFAGNPVQNYFSRGMEAEADRYALVYTGDPEAQVRLQVDLAVKNLADLAPPRFIEWFSYTHPAALERIHLAEQAGQ